MSHNLEMVLELQRKLEKSYGDIDKGKEYDWQEAINLCHRGYKVCLTNETAGIYLESGIIDGRYDLWIHRSFNQDPTPYITLPEHRDMKWKIL